MRLQSAQRTLEKSLTDAHAHLLGHTMRASSATYEQQQPAKLRTKNGLSKTHIGGSGDIKVRSKKLRKLDSLGVVAIDCLKIARPRQRRRARMGTCNEHRSRKVLISTKDCNQTASKTSKHSVPWVLVLTGSEFPSLRWPPLRKHGRRRGRFARTTPCDGVRWATHNRVGGFTST